MSMEFLRSRRVQAVGLFGTVALALAVANNQGVDAGSAPVECTPVNPTMWTPTSPYFNSQRAAEALGVSIDAIQDGSMGDAFCEDGVEPALVEDARVTVRMSDGALCMAIGVISFDIPDYSKRYQDVLVVCPGNDPANVAI